MARVAVSYFFPVSLYSLPCCEQQAQAWGDPCGVSWLPELLQSIPRSAQGKGGPAVLRLLPCV